MSDHETEHTEMDFGGALARLEALVEQIESADLSLEESLKVFEEGVKLTRNAQNALKLADQKVAKLTEKGIDHEFKEFVEEEGD